MQLAHDIGGLPQSDAASVEASSDADVGAAVYDWDLATDTIKWGSNLAAVLGIGSCDHLSTGLAYAEHLAAESPTSRYEAIMAAGGCDTGGGVAFTAIYGLLPAKRSNAAPIWIEDTGRWFADATDRPGCAHGVIRVITERFEADRRRGAARRDPVTGAVTRAHFIEHVTRRLSLSGGRTSTFAVLLIGIDMRDGPAISVDDPAMEAAMVRLRAEMRAHEIVARHAASELAVLLDSCNAEQAAAAAARFGATIEATNQPVLRARIGAVLAPCRGCTPQALLHFAEDALAAARLPTGQTFVLHDPGAARVARPAAQDEILSALEEGRVVLALQPVVDATTRVTMFYEALLRIRRLDGTLTLPDVLVPKAEKNGYVALLDRRVLDLACSMLAADRKLALSINASVASLHESCWLDHLRAACKLRPDAARRLTIEITETRAIADIEATRAVLTAIKSLGVKIAIDDFGSGHSSFRNLRRLPIDYLKIDGAFAQNLAHSADNRVFIRTLIDLARNLRIATVAEWIEDEATARILADWGVDYLQGHLFGKPEIPAPVPLTDPTGIARRRQNRP